MHAEEHAVRARLDAGRGDGGAACTGITECAEREHHGERQPRWLAARYRRHACASRAQWVACQDRARRMEKREARWRMVHGIDVRGQPRTSPLSVGELGDLDHLSAGNSRQARGQCAVHAAWRQHSRPVRARRRESGVQRVRRNVTCRARARPMRWPRSSTSKHRTSTASPRRSRPTPRSISRVTMCACCMRSRIIAVSNSDCSRPRR